jgi:hypothetical protein
MQTVERPGLIAGTSHTPPLAIPPAALGLTVGPWRIDRIEPTPFPNEGCPDGVIGFLLVVSNGDRFEVETVIDGATIAQARHLAVMLDMADRMVRPRSAWPTRLIVPVLECGHIREALPLVDAVDAEA